MITQNMAPGHCDHLHGLTGLLSWSAAVVMDLWIPPLDCHLEFFKSVRAGRVACLLLRLKMTKKKKMDKKQIDIYWINLAAGESCRERLVEIPAVFLS